MLLLGSGVSGQPGGDFVDQRAPVTAASLEPFERPFQSR
jgi:hypothetical protein